MVRFQNNTLASLRVIFTLFFCAFFGSLVAQNTPPPIPPVCQTSPVASFAIGGDFDIVGPSGMLTNTVCLEPLQNDIELSFLQNNPPAVGVFTVANSIAYIQNVTATTDFLANPSPFLTTNKFTYGEGYFWTAQFGINGNSDSFYNCKLIKVVKRQPVTATIVTCGTSEVTVTIPSQSQLSTNNHSKYIIEWGPSIPPTEVVANGSEIKRSRNYTPSTDIVVRGEYTDIDGNFSCDATQPFSQLPDPTKVLYIDKVERKANRTDYEIGFEDFEPNTVYKISYALADGNYAWQEDSGNHLNGTGLITGLDPNQNYCFRITYVDNCGFAAKNSNAVCSISLEENVISDTQVDLEWNKPLSPLGIFQQSDLEIDQINCPAGSNCFNLIPFSSPLTSTHTFNGLDCSKIFTFQVINVFLANIGGGMSKPVEIISNEVEIDPSSTSKPPKPVFPAVVSYANGVGVNEVNFNIFFENPAEFKSRYNFYRSVAGSTNFTQIGTNTNNTFIDTNVNPDQENYCYKYTYFDVCGNESEQSDAYCTIFLNSSSPNQLEWTPYVIPNVLTPNDVIYTVVFIDENGGISAVANTTNLSESVATQISNTEGSKASFQVLATQSVVLPSGNAFPFTSRSNIFTFELPSAAFIPTAFTPNGDIFNPTFKPELRFVQSGTMIIYDRWGSIIFETNDLSQGWDGTEAAGSRLAPVGTYAYKIQTISEDGTPTFYSGSVTLIR